MRDLDGPKGSENESVVVDNVVEEIGEDLKMKIREIGKANILAWGETRGRYLDE
jgi:hypothetical protein